MTPAVAGVSRTALVGCAREVKGCEGGGHGLDDDAGLDRCIHPNPVQTRAMRALPVAERVRRPREYALDQGWSRVAGPMPDGRGPAVTQVKA